MPRINTAHKQNVYASAYTYLGLRRLLAVVHRRLRGATAGHVAGEPRSQYTRSLDVAF